MQRADIRMIQQRHGAGLALKSLVEVSLGNLDCDETDEELAGNTVQVQVLFSAPH